jgi:hypothetical protein
MAEVPDIDRPDIDSQQRLSALDQLDQIGAKTATASTRVGIVTFAHLLICIAIFLFGFAGPSFVDVSFSTLRLAILLMLLLEVFFLFSSIVVIWQFDRLSRMGNLIYQEVIDDTEQFGTEVWRGLKVRITLRRFVLNATLPFYRKSESGSAAYVLVNILLSISVWVFVGMHR